MSYLVDFLFPAERANAKVSSLSGGERNRLLLARLFARPANLLVLDEPTNDLDIDTLELLESLLQDYTGTVILVSHDRAFLDNVVTQVLVHDPDAAHPCRWTENPGGYSEWQAVLRRRVAPRDRAQGVGGQGSAQQGRQEAPAPTFLGHGPVQKKAKLSYKEMRDLDTLPGRIAALEAEQKTITATLADPATYARTDPAATAEGVRLKRRFDAIEGELLEALERWEMLEKKRG